MIGLRRSLATDDPEFHQIEEQLFDAIDASGYRALIKNGDIYLSDRNGLPWGIILVDLAGPEDVDDPRVLNLGEDWAGLIDSRGSASSLLVGLLSVLASSGWLALHEVDTDRRVVVLLLVVMIARSPLDQPSLRLPRRIHSLWLQYDAQYRVQSWTLASTNPTWGRISRSGRSSGSPPIHSNDLPLADPASVMISGCSTPLPPFDPQTHQTVPRSGWLEQQRHPRHHSLGLREPASFRSRQRGSAGSGCSFGCDYRLPLSDRSPM